MTYGPRALGQFFGGVVEKQQKRKRRFEHIKRIREIVGFAAKYMFHQIPTIGKDAFAFGFTEPAHVM